MPRLFLAVLLLLASPLASAWNSAGHRLIAVIAWSQMSAPTRHWVTEALQGHPDSGRWIRQARSSDPQAIFAEAATWPDAIRDDPRFYDAGREAPTAPLPGLTDTARHKDWHYVDLDRRGGARHGQLDRQLERLARLLRSTRKRAEISYALPWLEHLVGDIHQPLHVGRPEDEGGNRVAIENPFDRRHPQTTLHAYWDNLPGPSGRRGRRLERRAAQLLATCRAPAQGDVERWRDESHRLLKLAYPETNGAGPAVIGAAFRQETQQIADRRLCQAGYRLGRLLEEIHAARVSRGTRAPAKP